ncbi:DUF6789 family protein [Bradyrhizobium sp. USDA 4353]
MADVNMRRSMQPETAKSGLTAGVAATVAAAIGVLGGAQFGVVPRFSLATDFVTLASQFTSTALPPTFGGFAFVIGGVFCGGLSFGPLSSHLPGGPLLKGLAFGMLVWIITCVISWAAAPLTAGVAVFNMTVSIVYGTVLSLVFSSQRGAAAIEDVTPN